MGDLPQWAMEKARAIVDEMNVDWTGDGRASDAYACEQRRLSIENIARALVEAEARGIERAAKLLEEGYEMDVAERYRDDGKPSKHDKCSHGKYHWEDCERCAVIAIRKLMEPTNEQ